MQVPVFRAAITRLSRLMAARAGSGLAVASASVRARIRFPSTLRRAPTVNAEGPDRVGRRRRKALGEARLGVPFGPTAGPRRSPSACSEMLRKNKRSANGLADVHGATAEMLGVLSELAVLLLRQAGASVAPTDLGRHNYFCHDHTGRNFIGHGCEGHNYMGHDDIGHDYIGHSYIDHNYFCHNHTGHNHMGLYWP